MALKVLETLRSNSLIAILSSAFVVCGPVAMAQQGGPGGGGGQGPGPRPIDCASDSLQEAIDRASSGDTVFFEGTCSEDIVIKKDRITLNGDPNGLGMRGGQGVIDGQILVTGADNIALMFLTVIGSGDGVGVIDSGHVDILMSVFDGNEFAGVGLENASVVKIAASDLTNNVGNGLVLNRNSVAEMLCDNVISGNGDHAVKTEEGSSVRTKLCDDDAALSRDTIEAAGGANAFDAFNGGTIDVRGVNSIGPIEVAGTATFRVQHSDIVGNVDAKVNSFVGFRPNSDLFGTLTCDSTSGIFEGFPGLDEVQCGDTCEGSVASTCGP